MCTKNIFVEESTCDCNMSFEEKLRLAYLKSAQYENSNSKVEHTNREQLINAEQCYFV